MGRLEIEELTKKYAGSDEGIVAVSDLNISIDDGEFLVLVGPSGCGKSTTLRCVAGLESVTSGEIILDGTPITDLQARDRDMAMVFQNYALYPHMTARENIGFGLKMSSDYSSEDIRSRVDEVADMMGISPLLDDYPSELSGGQQQRVALGRAIVREPEVFLLDEPLSNLDAKLRNEMRTELQQLQQDLGVTTIYVTHDQTEAMTMGDRIAILNNGELQQIGTPLECYNKPENLFVAGFIGSPSMNFFNVTRETSLGTHSLTHEEFTYTLTDNEYPELSDARDKLVLGIRPGDIQVVESSVKNSIEVDVSVVEPLGENLLVYFELGNDLCTASVESELEVEEGDTLEVLFPEDYVHLFDENTGAAIRSNVALSRSY